MMEESLKKRFDSLLTGLKVSLSMLAPHFIYSAVYLKGVICKRILTALLLFATCLPPLPVPAFPIRLLGCPRTV